MKTQKSNTIIAKCKNGKTYIDFKGSDYAKPAFVVVDENNFLHATYNRKNAGIMSPGMELGSEVKKATIQKWIGTHQCETVTKNHSSALDAAKSVTGHFYNGDLAKNSDLLF